METTGDNDNNNNKNIFNKLKYMQSENKKIFLTLKTGVWRKGFIIDLKENSEIVVIRDGVFGEVPLFFSEIKPESIAFAKEIDR